jgi:hypothetical protein
MEKLKNPKVIAAVIALVIAVAAAYGFDLTSILGGVAHP